MPRFVLSAWEPARVQYLVEAESSEQALALYECGDVGRPVLDEHDAGDVVDVHELAELVGGRE